MPATYRIMGRRGGMILLADGRTPARGLTRDEVLAELHASIHIGTNLDRFTVISDGTDEEFAGSRFEYESGADE